VIVINPAREPGLVKFAVPKSPSSMLKGGSEIASDYVQPRIGSDIALMKGIAKAVLEAGLEDRDFIAAHASGFEAFLTDIEALEWDAIVGACGVEQDEIEHIARQYGRAEHAVFAWGMGMTHHVHGVANVEAIANLAMLRGMVGKRFAGLLPLRGHSNVQGIGTIGVKPVLAKDVLARMEAAFGVSFPVEKGFDTMACLKAAEAGAIDSAVIMGGNLWGATPDTAFASRAMGAIGFKLFMTTTLNMGHVHGLGDGEVLVLPVTARDEEWESTTQESMFNYVRLSDGGIRRLENVRPESWILGEIGQGLLPNSPIQFKSFSAHAKVRDAIAAIVPGMEEMADIEVAKKEFHVRHRVMHTPEFGTPDGKAHFVVTPIPAIQSQRLNLATVRSEGQFNTIIYEEKDSYRGGAGRQAVFLNGEDMAAFGVREGQAVTLASDTGRMTAIVTEFDLPRGSAMAYYPEANVLVGTAVDPRSKTPAFKSVPVWIEAA
jgi:molybdopterin-dependent oxidoreductase alpha subunit